MGWLTDIYRRKHCMICYWNRLINLPDTRLTKKVFLWDYDLLNNNWCNELQSILESLNMLSNFQNKDVCNINNVKDELFKLCEHDWKNAVKSKPKLRTYVKFKNTYVTEGYVNSCLPRFQRSLLSQFRAGILPLEIETGRFKLVKDQNSGKMRKSLPEERI